MKEWLFFALGMVYMSVVWIAVLLDGGREMELLGVMAVVSVVLLLWFGVSVLRRR